MQVTINLDREQLAGIDKMAEVAGMEREALVKEVLDHMIPRNDEDQEILAECLAGLNDIREGRIASEEDVDAVFRKYGAR